MNDIVAASRNEGLLIFTNYNRIHVVPPCTITSAEAATDSRDSTARCASRTTTTRARDERRASNRGRLADARIGPRIRRTNVLSDEQLDTVSEELRSLLGR